MNSVLEVKNMSKEKKKNPIENENNKSWDRINEILFEMKFFFDDNPIVVHHLISYKIFIDKRPIKKELTLNKINVHDF